MKPDRQWTEMEWNEIVHQVERARYMRAQAAAAEDPYVRSELTRRAKRAELSVRRHAIMAGAGSRA